MQQITVDNGTSNWAHQDSTTSNKFCVAAIDIPIYSSSVLWATSMPQTSNGKGNRTLKQFNSHS